MCVCVCVPAKGANMPDWGGISQRGSAEEGENENGCAVLCLLHASNQPVLHVRDVLNPPPPTSPPITPPVPKIRRSIHTVVNRDSVLACRRPGKPTTEIHHAV